MPAELIKQFERLIRRDPACRGLIGSEEQFGPLCVGHLEMAAEHLSESATHVAIVTGFFVPHGDPPAAETDGPLGALMLACALEQIGAKTVILTDDNCLNTILEGANAVGFCLERVLSYPHNCPAWRHEFFTEGLGRQLTHLIAIERVGPSHTLKSLAHQSRPTQPPIEEFRNSVPVESYDHCHNMRGQIIDEHTADMHLLFEDLKQFRPEARTIGIGDGANEIGMGAIPWEELKRRLPGENTGCIPCRIPADWNIIAGTSNWGGYALAAATLLLRNQTDYLRDWDLDHQSRLLEHIIEHGPAVDGATARREATVDGLPFLTFIQPWEGIRRLLGFDST